MMKYYLIIIGLLLTNINWAQDTIFANGRLMSTDGEPVPFANIINITTHKHGTTSNGNGYFILETRNDLDDIIHISSIGYKVVRTSVENLLRLIEENELNLESKPKDLGSISIEGDRYKQEFIGKSTELSNKPNGTNKSFAISEIPGFSNAVFVKPKRKMNGILDRIHFYLTPEGSPEALFSVRLYQVKGKIKNNQIHSLDSFTEMHDAIILFSEGKPGWNTIELYDKDIGIDKTPFFVVFTSMTDDSVDSNNKVKSPYLGTFKSLEPKEIYKAYFFDGGLGYSDVSFSRTHIPAVYVEYSTTN